MPLPPRAYLTTPSAFGRPGGLAVWRELSSSTRTRSRQATLTPDVALRAAQLQHVIACKAQAAIDARNDRTTTNFVGHLIRQRLLPVRAKTETSKRGEVRRHAERLDDWLRGRRMMRGDDLALFERAFSWVTISPSAEELAAATSRTATGRTRPPSRAKPDRGRGALGFDPGDEWRDGTAAHGRAMGDEYRELSDADYEALERRWAAFDATVGRVAGPLLYQSMLAVRCTGPDELWEEDILDDAEVAEEPDLASWALIRPTWESKESTWRLDGGCGYVHVTCVARLDDDWLTRIHEPGWAVIDGRFIAHVLQWDGASRPVSVVALGLRLAYWWGWEYGDASAWVRWDESDTPHLEIVDGDDYTAPVSPM